MDKSIPIIELDDDDNMNTQSEMFDDEIEVYKVPIVTLEDSPEIPVISLDIDESPTNSGIVIDKTGNDVIVTSLTFNENSHLSDCTNISSDESDVEITNPSTLNDRDNCAHLIGSPNKKIAPKLCPKIQVQRTSNSSRSNSDIFIKNASTTPSKGCHISLSKKKQCKTCHKHFNDELQYQNHNCFHTDKKPFLCHTCNQIFTSKSVLIKHSKTHSADKPYVCDICFKAFSDKNILRMHYNTHTGEKPFACTICDKVFSNTVSLKNHYEMHIGETPYVCDVCLSSFDHKSSLCDHKLHEHNYLTLV